MRVLLYIIEIAFAQYCVGILLSSYQTKRIGLVLPATAYGLTSAASFALTSWWPLFLGYSLARLFAAYEIGVEPQPAQRPGTIGMLVNHGLHILAGIVGSEIFVFSLDGIALVATFSVVIQGLDAAGFYRTYMRLLTNEPEAQRQLPVKVAWLFATKVIWYGLITILAAAAVRSLG